MFEPDFVEEDRPARPPVGPQDVEEDQPARPDVAGSGPGAEEPDRSEGSRDPFERESFHGPAPGSRVAAV